MPSKARKEKEIPKIPIEKKKKGIAKRIAEKKEPKLVENVKTGMFIRGSTSSNLMAKVLTNLYMLKKPNGVQLKKKNNVVRPFEDVNSLEFLSTQNDSSLFMASSHSKKRPHNLIIGRMYEHHILDMIELGVENFKSIEDFSGVEKPTEGSKPCFLFQGELFDQKDEYKKLANILLDFYRGESVAGKLNLSGLEWIIVCTATVDKVYFRVYHINLKKSGTKLPLVELEECGPSMDWTIRRTKFAADDLMKTATKIPKQLKARKIKNVTRSIMGKTGRVHMKRQDLKELSTPTARRLITKKRKVLKKKKE